MTALDSLQTLILRVMAFARYYPAFACKVVAQNADLSLELMPDSTFLPGLSNVPMRTFAPGIQVKVAAGARCAVQFEDGNPGKPVATLFELGSLLDLSINAGTKVSITAGSVVFNSGLIPVAKEGSATVAHTHAGTAGPYPVVLTPVAPVIAPGAGSPTVTVP